jgi:hypothetical protein
MRYVCSCLVGVFAVVSALGASAELPIPENPRWQPIVDEVYLQEVGSRIESAEPLLSVAVVDNTAYVSTRRGVSRVEDGKLTPLRGSPGDARRMSAVAQFWRFDNHGRENRQEEE